MRRFFAIALAVCFLIAFAIPVCADSSVNATGGTLLHTTPCNVTVSGRNLASQLGFYTNVPLDTWVEGGSVYTGTGLTADFDISSSTRIEYAPPSATYEWDFVALRSTYGDHISYYNPLISAQTVLVIDNLDDVDLGDVVIHGTFTLANYNGETTAFDTFDVARTYVATDLGDSSIETSGGGYLVHLSLYDVLRQIATSDSNDDITPDTYVVNAQMSVAIPDGGTPSFTVSYRDFTPKSVYLRGDPNDLVWADTLATNVGALLDIRILGSLTIGGLAGVTIGLGVFFAFLKKYAGG